MLKLVLISLSFFFLTNSFSQIDSIAKTLNVDSVIVLGNRKTALIFIGNKEIYDIDISKKHSFVTLENILEQNSKISIKNYGEGQLSSISVKGFGSSHTDIAWNGVKLNSPTLGQADLSLITSGNNTDISFRENFNNNIAGIVQVQNKINFLKKKEFTISSSLSSLLNFSQSISYEFSKNQKFYSNSNLSFSYNFNRYKYINKALGNDNEIYLKNGANRNVHFEQINAFNLKNNNTIKLFFKTYFSDRNIAPTVYEFSSSKNQKDNLILGKIAWEQKNIHSDLGFDIAYINKQLRYKLSSNSTAILNSSNSIQTNFLYRLRKSNKFAFLLKINNDLQNGNSNNFSKSIWQNKLELNSYFNYKINKELSLTASVSEIVLDTKFSQPLPSFTFQYVSNKNPANVLLRFDYSRKARFPTINDLHWNPGGNPNLKEEYAHSLNAVFMFEKRHKKLPFSNKFEWFNVFSENYIQWQPSSNGYWQPVNIGNIFSRGFTNTFNIKYKYGIYTEISNSFSFNYTRTSKTNQQEQLIYVPITNWNNSSTLKTKWFQLIINQQFISKKYTNYTNSLSLDDYYLLDIILAKEFRFKNKHKFIVSIETNNLLNKTYFTYINRALPKRNYFLKLKYTFAK